MNFEKLKEMDDIENLPMIPYNDLMMYSELMGNPAVLELGLTFVDKAYEDDINLYGIDFMHSALIIQRWEQIRNNVLGYISENAIGEIIAVNISNMLNLIENIGIWKFIRMQMFYATGNINTVSDSAASSRVDNMIVQYTNTVNSDILGFLHRIAGYQKALDKDKIIDATHMLTEVVDCLERHYQKINNP